MRVFLAAIVIASLAGPAFAQQKPVPKYGELEGKKPHEIKAEKEAEEAYQRSLGRIPVPEKGVFRPLGFRPQRGRAQGGSVQDGGEGSGGEAGQG